MFAGFEKGTGQAQGLPLQECLRGKGKTAGVGCGGWGKAWPCGDLMGMAGRGLAKHFRLGTRYQYRHTVG